MKDEVPPSILDAHVKSVQSALKNDEKIDSDTFNIEKSGIAGTDSEGWCDSFSTCGLLAADFALSYIIFCFFFREKK